MAVRTWAAVSVGARKCITLTAFAAPGVAQVRATRWTSVTIGRGGMVTVLWGISLHDTGLMDGLSGRPQARSNGGVRGWGVLGGGAPPRSPPPSPLHSTTGGTGMGRRKDRLVYRRCHLCTGKAELSTLTQVSWVNASGGEWLGGLVCGSCLRDLPARLVARGGILWRLLLRAP